MKRILSLAAASLTLALSPGCAAPYALSTSAPLAHVVLFKFKPGGPSTMTEDFLKDVNDLLAPIPVIQGLWVGRPASARAELQPFTIDDYDIGLAVMVSDSRALEAYYEDPRHRQFTARYEPLTEVRVVQFTPRGSGPVQ